jgi:hypothetical protein
LVNEQNLETGFSIGIVHTLIKIISFLKDNYSFQKCIPEFKFCMRSLTSCFRNERAVASVLGIFLTFQLVLLEEGIPVIIQNIEEIKDEEVLANSIKIIRLCLKSDKVILILLIVF